MMVKVLFMGAVSYDAEYSFKPLQIRLKNATHQNQLTHGFSRKQLKIEMNLHIEVRLPR